MSKIRLGIIGAGNMGRGHIENILAGKCPEIEVTAVADRMAERRDWAHEKLPNAQIFTEGADLIASGAADAGIAQQMISHSTRACPDRAAAKAGEC